MDKTEETQVINHIDNIFKFMLIFVLCNSIENAPLWAECEVFMLRIVMKKKKFIVLIVSLLIITCLFVFFLLLKRRSINNIEVLENYRITYTDTNTESADLLAKLCQDRLRLKMKKSSESSHLFLKLSTSEPEANALGISLDEMEEKGFLILRRGNTIYLFSKSDIGLQRACFYLVYQLADEKGNLLLALDQQYTDIGKIYDDIVIGSTSIQHYSIIYTDSSTLLYGRDLQYYFAEACGYVPVLTDTLDTAPYILLDANNTTTNDYQIHALNGNITISGPDAAHLKDAVYIFANTYLNRMFTGSTIEKQVYHTDTLHIPSNISQPQEVWIPEREAIITLWNINYSRGVFFNNSTSLKTDVMSFSEEQLYEYVRMLKYCGFTGIQVTDMCSAWAGTGSYEYVHDRLRILADAAHSLDMKFTLWVWGAEFTGYGWVDNSVTYSADGYDYAYQNPDVLATFDKYYSIYAELADCCDRVIAHYYDPGQLSEAIDIAYFAKMLSDKFLTINPNIDFGVSCWVDKYDKNTFINALGNRITLYEGTNHDNLNQYQSFRSFCAAKGCHLGTWAWNTCEMEIDQLAQMNFNPHIIQSVYLDASKYDEILKPQYWSEMDSNHVLNVFSLYCAGQLLIDPNRNIDELAYEISLAAVGETYAKDFAEILFLLEDARSGYSWDTYWWNSENYILKSDNYPAEELILRCDNATKILQQMIDENVQTNTLPLPLELKEVLQLMLPHIQQIKSFSEFRIGLAEADALLKTGSDLSLVQSRLNALRTPISEYNTVVGLWGQIEARAQQELLQKFCAENNLKMPLDPTFDYERKYRIYSDFITTQKGHTEPVLRYAPVFQYGVAYGPEETARLIQELIDEGLLARNEEDNAVYLTDWKHYIYSFN